MDAVIFLQPLHCSVGIYFNISNSKKVLFCQFFGAWMMHCLLAPVLTMQNFFGQPAGGLNILIMFIDTLLQSVFFLPGVRVSVWAGVNHPGNKVSAVVKLASSVWKAVFRPGPAVSGGSRLMQFSWLLAWLWCSFHNTSTSDSCPKGVNINTHPASCMCNCHYFCSRSTNKVGKLGRLWLWLINR